MFHLMSRSCAVTIAKTTTAAHKDRAPQRVKIPGGGRYGAAPWTPWTPWTPLCTRIFENGLYGTAVTAKNDDGNARPPRPRTNRHHARLPHSDYLDTTPSRPCRSRSSGWGAREPSVIHQPWPHDFIPVGPLDAEPLTSQSIRTMPQALCSVPI